MLIKKMTATRLYRHGIRHEVFDIFFAALLLFSFCLLGQEENAAAWPAQGTDSLGSSYTILQRPQRVVSLVPEITEILLAMHAEDALAGITIHTKNEKVADIKRVGSFISPDIAAIETVNPDLILASDLHKQVRQYFQHQCPVLTFNVHDIKDGLERIRELGLIFGCEPAAAREIAKITAQLDLVSQKSIDIPADKKPRVIRLMGRDELMVPGDDSFQNDFIRAAGAVAPVFGTNGQSIIITTEQWQGYNPQIIYYCGPDEVPEILSTDGVKDVDAVMHNRIYAFSCDYTCRAGVNIGTFVTQLRDRIYNTESSHLAQKSQSGKLSSCVRDDE